MRQNNTNVNTVDKQKVKSMSNYFQISHAFDDAKFKGLSDGAKLLYGRIYNLSMGDHSQKMGGSVTASNEYFIEKCHWSRSKVCRLIDELKRWNLISCNYVKEGLTKTTRFITILPIQNAEHYSPVNHPNTEHYSPVNRALLTSEQSTTQKCSEHYSDLSTIINKEIKNKINKGNTQEEPLLVDNEVKDKKEKLDMNKDELMKWTFKYIIGYQWGTKEGYKDLLCNLHKEELAQLESYLEKNRLEKFKDPINTVIEKRLFVA